MIDEKAFADAKARLLSLSEKQSGIGTLAEKSLHKILKLYYEPREEYHEIPFLSYVCDVKNENGIIEIQTGSFTPLIHKLTRFLQETRVIVVYPIIAEKYLIWVNKETGELTEPKKSPKKGKYSDALPQLSIISELLPCENLTVRLVLLSADEYKYLDGYGESRKKRATKIEKLPRRIIDEFEIKEVNDIKKLLPPLENTFRSADFNKATGLKRRKAFFSLKFLERVGVIEKVGKDKNAFLYKLKDES